MKSTQEQLKAAGIEGLEVKKGLWGYYVNDPRWHRQTARVHKTRKEVIAAIIAGERPTMLEGGDDT